MGNGNLAALKTVPEYWGVPYQANALNPITPYAVESFSGNTSPPCLSTWITTVLCANFELGLGFRGWVLNP